MSALQDFAAWTGGDSVVRTFKVKDVVNGIATFRDENVANLAGQPSITFSLGARNAQNQNFRYRIVMKWPILDANGVVSHINSVDMKVSMSSKSTAGERTNALTAAQVALLATNATYPTGYAMSRAEGLY